MKVIIASNFLLPFLFPLLSPVAATEAGANRAESPLLRGVPPPVVDSPLALGLRLGINPRDILTCLRSRDKGGCDASDISDGEHCTWCSSETLGTSFCTVPDVGDAMKQFVQDLDCNDGGEGDGDGDGDSVESVGAGINPEDLLTCLKSTDKAECDATGTSVDDHCAWCSSDTLRMSFCTTPDVEVMMKQFVKDIDCDSDGDSNFVVTGLHPREILTCFKSADKDGCDATDTSDGGKCAWCSSETLGMSFCTTADAGDSMKQFVQDIDCDSDKDSEIEAEFIGTDINPEDILTCLQSSNKDGCDTTGTSDGGHCAWCSSETWGMSFCTTLDAGDSMKQFIQDIDCDSNADFIDMDFDPQEILTCFQSPNKNGCHATYTSEGGHCTWCSSESLGMSFCFSDVGDTVKQFVQDIHCDSTNMFVDLYTNSQTF